MLASRCLVLLDLALFACRASPLLASVPHSCPYHSLVSHRRNDHSCWKRRSHAGAVSLHLRLFPSSAARVRSVPAPASNFIAVSPPRAAFLVLPQTSVTPTPSPPRGRDVPLALLPVQGKTAAAPGSIPAKCPRASPAKRSLTLSASVPSPVLPGTSPRATPFSEVCQPTASLCCQCSLRASRFKAPSLVASPSSPQHPPALKVNHAFHLSVTRAPCQRCERCQPNSRRCAGGQTNPASATSLAVCPSCHVAVSLCSRVLRAVALQHYPLASLAFKCNYMSCQRRSSPAPPPSFPCHSRLLRLSLLCHSRLASSKASGLPDLPLCQPSHVRGVHRCLSRYALRAPRWAARNLRSAPLRARCTSASFALLSVDDAFIPIFCLCPT
ncbi:hypothetical protein ERJ75_001142000 [Trypanosoma vivax]|nr:hypothetical protein ERJ75_001142000 [Trypanosoma vivax]